MWAVGAVGEVGTLLWVVNAVKAQNHTKQEGAPPGADPGGSADNSLCSELDGQMLPLQHDHVAAHTMLLMRLISSGA